MKDKFITLAELKARPLPKDDEPVLIDPLTGEPKMLGVARAWMKHRGAVADALDTV